MNKNVSTDLWGAVILEQKALCKRLGVEFSPTAYEEIVGLSDERLVNPINGLRHVQVRNTSGWYIWRGEYSENSDFFKPLHALHLIDINSRIVKYLGLPLGYRFQIDDNGYEDVWFDASLLAI